MSNYKTPILTLEQVAAWWLPKAMKGKMHKDVRAALPSLQRGFVWDAYQVECLWDSIIQGFPIGSLLLSKIGEGSAGSEQQGHGSDGKIENATHFLLDGQQRTTAIALGFRNIWENGEGSFKGQAGTVG